MEMRIGVSRGYNNVYTYCTLYKSASVVGSIDFWRLAGYTPIERLRLESLA